MPHLILVQILISSVTAYVAYFFAVQKFKEKFVFKEIYLRRIERLEEVCKRAHNFRRALRGHIGKTGVPQSLVDAQDNFKHYFEDNAIYLQEKTVLAFRKLFYEGLNSLSVMNLHDFVALQDSIEEEIRKKSLQLITKKQCLIQLKN